MIPPSSLPSKRKVAFTCFSFIHIGETNGPECSNPSVWKKGGNFKFWHRDWSVGNKQGGRRKIQTRDPCPVDRLVEKKISPSAALSLFLFFFKRVRPSVGRRALKGVNLSLMVTRSVPAVEKQQTSERLETRRDVFRR